MCLLNLGTDVTFNCCCPVEHYVVVFSVGLLCIVLNFSVEYYCALFFLSLSVFLLLSCYLANKDSYILKLRPSYL